MSDWSRWFHQPKEGKSFADIQEEGNLSAVLPGGPAERARQLGLQSNGRGSYIDPNTGQVAARTVNGELVFYSQDGGAIADSSGGSQLSRAQPSWGDPITGMLVTPPSKAESPAEIASIPDATPAKPPAGYNDFMKRKKDQAYQMNAIAPQPMRMTPEQEAEQEQQQQDMTPDQGQAFGEAAGDGALQKFKKEYDKNQKAQQAPIEAAQKETAARDKALQKGGTDPESLTNRLGQGQPATFATMRQRALQARLGGLTAPSTLARGAGANALSLEDISAFRKYIKDGPQNKYDEITDEDLEYSMNYLKEQTGKKWGNFQSRLKGKGDPEPARKVVSRAREIVKSYLENHGQSAIDGSELPFSDSELDHGISLSNGGLDEGGNWRWLPKRFNQFKSDLDDDALMAALDKEEARLNDPDYKIKQSEDELTNFTRQEWLDKFENRSDQLNIADIRQATGKQGLQLLKALAEKNGISYYKDRGKVRDSGRAGGGTSLGVEELQDRLIEKLGIPSHTDIAQFDVSLIETLQRIEDKRSELDSMKRARRKEKAAEKKRKKMEGG